MDQDGANHRFQLMEQTSLTPRFSPTMQEITYLAYYNKKPRVYIFNIDTGQQEVLATSWYDFALGFRQMGQKLL